MGMRIYFNIFNSTQSAAQLNANRIGVPNIIAMHNNVPYVQTQPDCFGSKQHVLGGWLLSLLRERENV